jgi:hypothetical protein
MTHVKSPEVGHDERVELFERMKALRKANPKITWTELGEGISTGKRRISNHMANRYTLKGPTAGARPTSMTALKSRSA